MRRTNLLALLILLTGSDALLAVSHRRATTTRLQAIQEYTVEVSYEGKTCELSVRSNETILAALERAGVCDELAIPEVPSECRRGNCMTCSGRHARHSRQSSLRRGDDGLSPHMSREVSKQGFVLTCSSYVVGDGLKLEIGENHQVWNEMYRARFEDDSARLAGRAAMAKTIRMTDERNVERWAIETEAAFQKSGEQHNQ